jgi:trehalose 6-phosphate synthase/phosphatase
VNPYDITQSAEAYYRVLTMPRHERRARMRALRQRVLANGIDRWAESFLGALRAAVLPKVALEAGSPPDEGAAACARVREAPLLLLVDYDGTLVPFASAPELATPDADLMRMLSALADRPRTQLHLVSGRQRSVLESWFGQLPAGLHAEHGLWSRRPGGLEWERAGAIRPVAYDEVLSLLRRFTEVTPGSRIERKSGGLGWHFRLAPADVGDRSADALVDEVRRRFPSDLADVLRGEKVVEIRPAGIHKGLIVTRLLAETAPDALVVAVGDDVTDEDMFAAVPAPGLTVHVGPRTSNASLRLRDVAACRAFLQGILGGPPSGL